ncbi:alpha/beta hydrolase [Halorussus pelagicus]|uniref:alpha/beta hydrolase n=1 Tax=Halorussus pelagicus TaxID=2505977 RepID=UPI000FFCB1CC|nr:CocE/NonD family hydrolase [Halorussus pelagicus]
MHSEDLPIPGGRDVRATLDTPDADANADLAASPPDETKAHSASRIVVACPPHPQHRGHRGDKRLTAVSEALVESGIACLRFDYDDWDEGYGEREDARNALRWARERYDRVGVFGFSFGGAMATLAAATTDPQPDAVSLLAPASRLAEDLDAAEALADVEGPVQVVYGTRDDTADWRPLVERAKELECETVEMSADHFFVGQHAKVADAVGAFLVEQLG